MDIKDIKDAKVTHAGLLVHNQDGTTELQKITHAGLVARSPEGTAAKGMNIRGNEDLWVEIQLADLELKTSPIPKFNVQNSATISESTSAAGGQTHSTESKNGETPTTEVMDAE